MVIIIVLDHPGYDKYVPQMVIEAIENIQLFKIDLWFVITSSIYILVFCTRSIPGLVQPCTKKCMKSYNIDDHDKGDYTLKWFYIPNTNETKSRKPTALEKAFVYQAVEETGTNTFWGYLDTYGGHGYIINLDIKYQEAKALLIDLK